MPRRIRTRLTSEGPSPEPDAARRKWLAIWKGWAVARLPADASRTAGVHVRTAVERALVRLGPEDSEDEVRDVVLGVVDEAVARLRAAADAAACAEMRRTIIAGADVLLGLALRRFPAADVSAMVKRRGYSRAALADRLRRHLDRHITGGEQPEEIMGRIVAWVERRLAEQPQPPRRLSRLMAPAGAAMVTVGAMSLRNPQVKEVVTRGLEKARDKARALWARWTTRPSPPAQR